MFLLLNLSTNTKKKSHKLLPNIKINKLIYFRQKRNGATDGILLRWRTFQKSAQQGFRHISFEVHGSVDVVKYRYSCRDSQKKYTLTKITRVSNWIYLKWFWQRILLKWFWKIDFLKHFYPVLILFWKIAKVCTSIYIPYENIRD